MLELRDVSRSLGREPVLVGASLQISPDEPLAILGLQTVQHRDLVLKLLAGVDRPEAGTIRLDGRDTSRLRREKGRIVRLAPGGAKPTGQRVGRLIGREAAERVRLAGRLDAATNTLDLDQRLRLAIAMARSGRPSLILLDAPG